MFMDILEITKKKLIVFDRINPINGAKIEGTILQEKFQSFVGYAKIPHRHGFTTGEAVNFYYKYKKMSFDVEIIKIKGWKRNSFFDEYDLPWIPTSPNMPTLDTAIIYPGACLIEGTNISEGRGTTFPFFVIGLENENSFRLTEELNNLEIKNVAFSPLEFRPMFQKYEKKRISGVFITIKNRNKIKPLRLFIRILQTIKSKRTLKQGFFRKKAYEFEEQIPAIELLLGDDLLIKMFYENADYSEIDNYISDSEKQFLEQRKEFLFY
jgi:uncharacterized protein YbbC (DUF1343 family)